MRIPVFASLLLSPPAVLGSQWAIHLSPFTPTTSDGPTSLSSAQANLVLAHHLGLDQFHSLEAEDAFDARFNPSHQQSFFGNAVQNGLVVSIESKTPSDFLPESLMEPSFSVARAPSVSELHSTYAQQAGHIFPSVFSSIDVGGALHKRLLDVFDFATGSPAAAKFQEEAGKLFAFAEDESGENKFGSFDIQSLEMLANEFGKDSEQYITAAHAIKGVLSHAVAARYNVAAIIVSSSLHARAAPPQVPLPGPQPKPNTPLFSSSTCYATSNACTNGTASCSSRGQCVEVHKSGRTCFTCQCSPSINEKGHKVYWAGAKCEKADISTSFTLLIGTTLFMMFLGAFGIAMLYSIGNQELPSTLTGGAVSAHRE
jgi:hypothetical protein